MSANVAHSEAITNYSTEGSTLHDAMMSQNGDQSETCDSSLSDLNSNCDYCCISMGQTQAIVCSHYCAVCKMSPSNSVQSQNGCCIIGEEEKIVFGRNEGACVHSQCGKYAHETSKCEMADGNNLHTKELRDEKRDV